MKLFVLLIFSSICYINVYGNLVFETAACVTARMIGCNIPRNSNLDVSKINVHFYDFKHLVFKSFRVDKAAKGVLSIDNLNKKNKFLLYVGGYRSHINSKTTELMKNALRHIDHSYLIIVDHSEYTNSKDGYIQSYKRSVKHVPNIGKKLAEMLEDLKKGGVSPKYIHGIGHSLGSQILGHVGKNFISRTGQKISRITALDPAGPCFEKESEHVRSGHANYVEIYHCNARVLGSDLTVGDVDFFANNGKSQPQCGDPYALCPPKAVASTKCSHKKCVELWAASVQNERWYPAYNCKNYKDFNHGKCYHNKKTTAGFWNPGTATGKYYFSTNNIQMFSTNKSPFRSVKSTSG